MITKQYVDAIEENNIVSKTDINGIITFANEEFCKISKYSKEELIGKNHNIVRHPDIPKEAFKKLWDTILAKKTYKATVKNMAKDGSTFYVNTTVIPIIDENGEIVEFVAIRYDVTKAVTTAKELEEKEKELEMLNATLEERVKKQTLKLKELNKNLEIRVQKEVEKNREKDSIMFQQARFAAMGEMIANIAHQWRQPLSELSILLFKIKNAFLKQDSNEFEKDYNDCKTVINRMSKTIDDFRNFFKPTREKNDFFIEDSVEEAIFIIKETLKSHNIKINFNNKHSIIMTGYPNEILQVILNILNNAKDALISKEQKDKKIDIQTVLLKDWVQVSICDNAGGIKSDIIDKIFDPYFTTKHSKQGTGIGLYMSKKIVEQNGGLIKVVNKKDGACFIVKLPIT